MQLKKYSFMTSLFLFPIVFLPSVQAQAQEVPQEISVEWIDNGGISGTSLLSYAERALLDEAKRVCKVDKASFSLKELSFSVSGCGSIGERGDTLGRAGTFLLCYPAVTAKALIVCPAK